MPLLNFPLRASAGGEELLVADERLIELWALYAARARPAEEPRSEFEAELRMHYHDVGQALGELILRRAGEVQGG